MQRFGFSSLNLSNHFVTMGHMREQSRFFYGHFLRLILMMSFSTHHLLATFTHKSSVTVAELRDYITRRKNKKNLNS